MAALSAHAPSEAVVDACREYTTGVGGLLNTLERDVYQAADRCWRLADRSVQLRGGLLRGKSVVVQEASFQAEVEQHELAGALEQWREAVKGSSAAAALALRVAEQHLVAVVGRALEADPPAPPEALLAQLGALLGAHDAVAALGERQLRNTLGLLARLAVQVAVAWRGAGGMHANDLLAAHATAPPEVVAALTAPPAESTTAADAAADADAAAGGSAGAAVAAPPALPPELAASLAALHARQSELLEELAGAADMLRFWGRRGEKAAAGSEPGGGGREGDVPPQMVEAQSLLWGTCQGYDDEQAAADLRTRQLVCTRYRPTDAAALAARADEFQGGERLAAQQSLTYEPEFVELRGQARALAARFVQDKALACAAEQLHQLRFLLLHAALPAETAPVRQQLLVRVAEALLDGSTPPAAAPLLVGMLQEGLRAAEVAGQEAATQLSEQDRARLVPMVCRGLAQPHGGRAVLRQAEGAALLRSLLRPEALLDGGQLEQFGGTLKMVADACAAAAVPAPGTEALLAVFDATRYAVLVCERGAEDEGGTAADAGAGVQALLLLAHSCLGQPGGGPTGLALLEGVLTLRPAAYLAAALQLALACGRGEAQARALAMLCRVPSELLPPAVVGDALVQLAEALDGGSLAPPFLPHELIGRLYRTPAVLGSLRLAVERGAEAAAGAAADDAAPGAGGQGLWTLRVGSTHEDSDGAGATSLPGDEHIASGSGSAGGSSAGGGSSAAAQQPGGQSLLLLPLQEASGEPLAVLMHRLVGAILSSLLRRAGGALDAASLSEELSALLELLMLPSAEEGAWMLQWLWQGVYQESLRDFLRDVAAADPGCATLAVAAFQSYWASLPWEVATFHAAAPGALAVLRLHLVGAAADGGAAALLARLDFTPVLAKAAPPARPVRLDRVYSLVDEEDEEDEEMEAGPCGSGGWAAELGLLALHACLLLPTGAQPEWLRHLLVGVPAGLHARATAAQRGDEGEVQQLMRSALSATLLPLAAAAGEQQPLLPHLLAAADWHHVAAVMHAEAVVAGSAAPWLLLPALLVREGVQGGELGSRLVHAASLLSRGAALEGSSHAAEAAAGAVGPLLLCSLCQGERHEQQQQQQQQRGDQQSQLAGGADAAAAAAVAQTERIQVPDDFPRELLEDTVEGQQLLLLQQQEAERQEMAAAWRAAQLASAAEGAAGGAAGERSGGGAQQVVVEVQACWSLTAEQHVALLQQALVPLAASRASSEAAASWQGEQCPPELAAAGGEEDARSALREWRSPHLPDLLQATAAAAASVAAAPAAGGATDDGIAAVACVAAALLPLVRRPVTLLQREPLPFSNSELPLDADSSTSAVFVSVAPEAAGSAAAGQWHGRGAAGAGSGAADERVVKGQLLLALQDACKQPGSEALAACLLRLVYACPQLHASPAAVQLSEGVLRFMAAPEQDGGPPGQGEAAAAASEATLSASSTGMQPAVTAMQGLPPAALLALAQSAAQRRAPLTAALVLERLRQGFSVLPKEEWQAHTTQVLQVALHAEADPAYPYDLVAVWLGVLAWVGDARWRRLAGGAHQAALLDWLEALELRVVALRLAQPEDFEGFGAEGSDNAARRLLSGAADRLRSMRQHIPGLAPTHSPAHGTAAAAADAHAAGEGEAHSGRAQAPQQGASEDCLPASSGAAFNGGDAQLGQRLSSGFKGLLAKAGGKKPGGDAAGAAGEAQADAAQGSPEKRGGGWGDKMRHRLAKMGLGKEQAGTPLPPPPPTITPATTLAPPGHPYSPGLVAVAEEGGSAAFSEATAGSDVGHLGFPASPAASSVGEGPHGGGGGGAVRAKLSSGLQAVGRGFSKVGSSVKGRLAEVAQRDRDAPSADELAEMEREVACRIGLAAFAVSAYVKSVLCPSLSGGGSAGPATPTHRPGEPGPFSGPPNVSQRLRHRTRSSFGSLQLDADYLRELDRVLEARSELDTLDVLAACPLLAAHPGRFQAFLGEAPQLLAAATSVAAFQVRLQQLLFARERQLLVAALA